MFYRFVPLVCFQLVAKFINPALTFGLLYSFIVNYLEPFSYLIYLIAISLRLKVHPSPAMKVLFGFNLLATLLMLDASLMVLPQVHNLWLYNILFLTAVLSTGFYAYTILKSPLKKKIVLLLVSGITVYFIVHDLLYKNLFEIDSVGLVLLSASVVVFSFMYFHQILNNMTETAAFSDFDSWLVSAYLLYYLGSFFIFLCYNYFTDQIVITRRLKDRELLTILWGVHNVFLFLSAVITLTGSVWTTYRSQSR